MKKFLLTLATISIAMAANAGEVTFDFTKDNYGLPPVNADDNNKTEYVTVPSTIKSGDVEIELNGDATKNCWRMWTDGLRAYSKGAPYFTVSTTNGEKITGVELSVVSGGTFAIKGTSENITTWTGNESSVTFQYTGAAPDASSSVNKAVKTITVTYGDTQLEVPNAPEVKEFTVPEALVWLAQGNSGEAIVSGVVTSVTGYNSTYGSITYYIGAEENATELLQIYGGLGLNGAKFNGVEDVIVGAKVKVKGSLKIYKNNSTGEEIPEMDMNNVLLSYDDAGLDKPVTPQGTITVAEALQWMGDGYEGSATVKGVITKIDEISSDYGNATYWIADNLDSPNQLEVYRGYYLNGDKFTSEDQLEVGATVVVSGTLVDYKGTFEFTTGSKILSYETAGVAEIGYDNTPAVYYNLQGVKVANPESGLYIRRQGNKSVKVLVR